MADVDNVDAQADAGGDSIDARFAGYVSKLYTKLNWAQTKGSD